jgi:acetylornithine deacetylase/succinyl-diaminopimelate desuccinylase-like protein
MIPEPLDITQTLIRLQTVNPPGDEAVAQQYLRDLLEQAGFSVEMVEAVPGRPNLMTRLQGRGEKPPLLFYGHTDVVGVDGQQWQFPPFDAVVQDGILYGRGTLDMKAGVAMLVHSLLRAAAEDVRPAGDIVLVIVADEETGGEMGMQYLLREHPQIFNDIRYAIGEFGGFPLYVAGHRFYRIGVSQKQYARIRLTFRAAGGHGSLPVNETVMGLLGTALAKLDAHKMPYHKTPLAERIVRLLCQHLDGDIAQAFDALLDPLTFDNALTQIPDAARFESLFRDTANPTIVSAGAKFNVIPSQAVVDIDARILPGRSSDDVVRELHDLLGSDVEIDVVAAGPKTKPDVDYALFDMLADLLRSHDPDGTPIPYLFNESPDGRLLEDHGLQNYGFLPMNLPPEIDLPSLIHGENERVPVSAIQFGADILFDLVAQY